MGNKDGEELLRKHIPPERFEKFHKAFDEHPFWSLMSPAMLPPPTPFKLFVLAAAVSEMQFGHFLLAIFSGRCVRFLVLSFLTLRFGPGFVDFSGRVFRQHFHWVLAAVGSGAGILPVCASARLARKNLAAENAKESLSSQRTA